MEMSKFLVREAGTVGGQWVFRGTRVTLRTVLASLAEGDSFEALLEAFPGLTTDHLRAAVAFAAGSALDDQPMPASPHLT
jgi:uncharacterized protein (DUF433 family)